LSSVLEKYIGRGAFFEANHHNIKYVET